ncbi:uncharacterized protein BP5553_03499 [Venustampulla echinocandica]|uniref:Transcription factor domain-containing protein n=1 Tax=Venustampulla echinocandica TaxID=2656787 RepID=A0A370TUG3_9HELO|nr:uncharacterized protein BP5553_03499 [Venustampulla echinocandica]RDL39159.1 hypothetical protein BP5553_03499 [Venustampulla echinocandica]
MAGTEPEPEPYAPDQPSNDDDLDHFLASGRLDPAHNSTTWSITAQSVWNAHRDQQPDQPAKRVAGKRRRIPATSRNQTTETRYPEQPRHLPQDPAPSGTPLAPILPSIFSSLPYPHIGRGYGGTGPQDKQLCDNLPETSTARDAHGRTSGRISTEDTMQLIDLFRDRLLVTVPILIPADYEDGERLIATYPNLVSCISYVTARYIPGYEEVRDCLVPVVSAFLQTAYNTKAANAEEELATMQALIILYVFARSNVIERPSESIFSNNISFWSIKAACEMLAMQLRLHRSSDGIRRQLQLGNPLKRNDTCVRKYLYWLWLYTTAHHVSIATGTPPSINADASIRAAPTVLQSIQSNDDVLITLREAQLCLLWDKLGEKDPSLKEWWCSIDHDDDSTSEMPPITFEDVDAALNEWKAQSSSDRISNRKGFMSLSPEYYFQYTRFCLNTHFIRRLASVNIQSREVEAIQRSVDSAVSVLSISGRLGPAKRDQLRYSPGFLFVTLSFCSSFILEAIQLFPTLFPDPALELGLIRKIASFMRDLGVDRSHGASACGRSVLRKLDATIERINRRQAPAVAAQREPGAMAMTPATSGVDEPSESMVLSDFDQYYSNSIFDFPGLVDGRIEGSEFDFGSLRYPSR